MFIDKNNHKSSSLKDILQRKMFVINYVLRNISIVECTR